MSVFQDVGRVIRSLLSARGVAGCARLDAAAKDDGCSDSDARVGYRRTVVRLGPSSVSTGANAEGSPNHVEGCPDRPPRPAVHSVTRSGCRVLLSVEWLA